YFVEFPGNPRRRALTSRGARRVRAVSMCRKARWGEFGRMPQQLLKFVDIEKEMPEKRLPAERRRDFEEIYGEFAAAEAKQQAGRCSQCGVPFCQVHCPLGNNIPDWLM